MFLLFFESVVGRFEDPLRGREVARFADFCDKPILSVQLEQVTLAHGLYMLLQQQYQMLDATANDFTVKFAALFASTGLCNEQPLGAFAEPMGKLRGSSDGV